MFKKYLTLLFISIPFLFIAQDQGLAVDDSKEVLTEMSSSVAAATETAKELGLDEKIDKTFGEYTGWFVEGIFYEIPFSDSLKVPWVLIVLIFGALYFTLYFKFINVRGFKTSINIVRGKYDDLEENQKISYKTEKNKGKLSAIDIKIVD